MPEQEQEQEQEEGRARAFWSGTITFGLVSIPVELYPANRSQRVSLRMVSPDGVPLARRYFCSKDDRELDWDDIVRGYEIEKDSYVVVTDEELEKLAPDKTRDIDLRRFVQASEIDPIFFERAYYLAPGGNSTKAYRLLAETMERTDRAGIATFVMRGKEYLVAILAARGILRAETLRFADEVRTWEDVGLPEPVNVKAAAVKKIEKEIARLAEKKFSEKELTDQRAEKLLKLVAKKEKSGEDVVAAGTGADLEPSEGTIDLMEVLKRSLQGQSGAGAGGTAKSSGRKGSKKAAGRKSTGKRQSKSASKSASRSGSQSDAKAGLKTESKQELYERAKKLDIPGRSSMSRDELLEAIRRTA